jgi:ribosomal protein S18 acetylase RimI-like enzyme
LQERRGDERYGLASQESEILYAVAANDDVAGVLCWEKEELFGDCVVTLLYIVPPHRRLGLASRLWEEMVRRVAEAGLRRLVGDLSASNRPALAFFQKHGVPLPSFRCMADLSVKAPGAK